jgi:hypothetical protein
MPTITSYTTKTRLDCKQQIGVLGALRWVFEGDPWLLAAADPNTPTPDGAC